MKRNQPTAQKKSVRAKTHYLVFYRLFSKEFVLFWDKTMCHGFYLIIIIYAFYLCCVVCRDWEWKEKYIINITFYFSRSFICYFVEWGTLWNEYSFAFFFCVWTKHQKNGHAIHLVRFKYLCYQFVINTAQRKLT